MADTVLTSQHKQTRAAPSPLVDERTPKRSRKSTEPAEMAATPEVTSDVIPGGDALVVLNGLSTAPNQPIGLRVSSSAMSMVSLADTMI